MGTLKFSHSVSPFTCSRNIYLVLQWAGWICHLFPTHTHSVHWLNQRHPVNFSQFELSSMMTCRLQRDLLYLPKMKFCHQICTLSPQEMTNKNVSEKYNLLNSSEQCPFQGAKRPNIINPLPLSAPWYNASCTVQCVQFTDVTLHGFTPF